MSWPRTTVVTNEPDLIVSLPDVSADTYLTDAQLSGIHNYIKVDSTANPVTLAVSDAWAVDTYLYISGIKFNHPITLRSRPNAGALGVDAHTIAIYPRVGAPDATDGSVAINEAGSVVLKKVSATKIVVWDQSSVAVGGGSAGGTNGIDGQDGDSAYQIWLGLGNTGTQQDFIDSLAGDDGVDGLTAAQITALVEPYIFAFDVGDFVDVDATDDPMWAGFKRITVPAATHGKGAFAPITPWGEGGTTLPENLNDGSDDIDDAGLLRYYVETGHEYKGFLSISQGTV